MRIYYAAAHRELKPANSKVVWSDAVKNILETGPKVSVLSSYEYFKNGSMDVRFLYILKLRSSFDGK